MGQLIDLTVTRRKSANKDDSFSTPQTYGFDVEDIIVPIKNDGSNSYFTARQLKGTHPSSRLVGNTDYWVDETLAQIAAKSSLLVVLTVTKRRDVVVNNESYVFVTSRFSENIKPITGGGSKFFYQEDGDVNLVEYEVSEDVADIISQANVPAGDFIEMTYAQASAAAAACTLVEGEHYKITDRADLGIILLATSPCSFSLEGQGIFLNPDFQAAGALGADVQGVWYVGGEAGYVNGNIVFWNGNHYEVIDDAAFAGTDPSATPLAYTLLSKSVANGYIEEVDFIFYDFANDKIIKRVDERNNEILYDGINNFQWGNDLVKANKNISNNSFFIINQRGIFLRNTMIGACSVVCDETHEGTVVSCNFNGGTAFFCNLDSGELLQNCSIDTNVSIVFDPTKSYSNKSINSLGSTFEADLDIASAFAAGTLTIPVTYNYIGIFNLLNSAGETIDEIVNLPTTHKCRFYPTVGATQLFSHSAIAGATANQLVSDAAAINTITGRTNGSDFIEYEKAGNLNRRYNAVIAA